MQDDLAGWYQRRADSGERAELSFEKVNNKRKWHVPGTDIEIRENRTRTFFVSGGLLELSSLEAAKLYAVDRYRGWLKNQANILGMSFVPCMDSTTLSILMMNRYGYHDKQIVSSIIQATKYTDEWDTMILVLTGYDLHLEGAVDAAFKNHGSLYKDIIVDGLSFSVIIFKKGKT